ncbi:MAG: permease-like cell division protein FtsX [Candidatus Andersenbacteria bacterium]|nr:permease-like cell division protein FtsX [bacterium]MDZ4225423.1 permease-like cell division protein FtsX [Candidatus Andersenbacteria bacterium]
MVGISLARIFKAALQNFWRNIWLSVATAAIMVITLLMISFLYFANIFGGQVLHSIQEKVDLSVTFKEDVQEQYIQAVANELETRQDVEKVTVITSDQALESFKSRHTDDPLIEESLGELENNPLPASIFILATEPRFYENIAKQLESDKYTPFIDSVNYEGSSTVIDRLIALIASVKNVGTVITIVFALLAVLIMFNTVRLAIYSFREEIDIMRLVGASRWFIQGPFIIESVIVSLFAVIISTAILYPVLNTIAPHLQRFFFDAQSSPFNIYDYAVTHWARVIGLQVGAAVGLAIISSMIAIRRYLRD